MAPHLVEEGAGLEEKNAGVPGEPAALQIFPRALVVGLFDKGGDAVNATQILVRVADLYVSILGVGTVRAHAEGHQVASLGQSPVRGQGRGGGRVPAERLENDRVDFEPGAFELALDEETMLFTGD